MLIAPIAPHIEVPDPEHLLTATDPREAFYTSIRPAPRHEYLTDGVASNGELPSAPTGGSFNESDMSDKPSCPGPGNPLGTPYNTEPFCVGDLPALRPEDTQALDHQYKTTLAAMLAVDDLVGTVVDALNAADLLNETVLLFTSDNGFFYGQHRLSGKEFPYEEAIRVPLIVSDPVVTKRKRATASQIVVNNDLAPTIAELAGVTPPYATDGMSLVPLLKQPRRDDWQRNGFLVEHWFSPPSHGYPVSTSQ